MLRVLRLSNLGNVEFEFKWLLSKIKVSKQENPSKNDIELNRILITIITLLILNCAYSKLLLLRSSSLTQNRNLGITSNEMFFDKK